MRVTTLRNADGSRSFRWGSEGTPYPYDITDADSTAIAFTKAVNDGIESGEEIEGEAAIAVAEVLKAAGELAWPAGGGYNFLRDLVQNSLPKTNQGGYESCPWYVQDISLEGNAALVCGWDGGSEENYVIPFTVHGDGADATVVIADKSAWLEVEREFVTKAGRTFSGKHLAALEAAHESLGALIAAGTPKMPQADEDESTEKSAEGDLNYAVSKSDKAMRYTLGPLYAPLREDAHGEWIEDEPLHKALHEFVRDSADTGRRINLQHGDLGDVTVGEWVECVRWPYEHTIKMTNAKGEVHDVDMPAGTVYLGVVWDEDYWDTEKAAPKGIDGYSLGGRAMKTKGTSETLKDMGYKVRKHAEPASA